MKALTILLFLNYNFDPPNIPIRPYAIDQNIIELSKEAVRSDPTLLAQALTNVWSLLPEKDVKREEYLKYHLKYLVVHIELESTDHHIKDPRVIAAGSGRRQPIFSMILQVGMPAIPTLLNELTKSNESKNIRIHKEECVRCIYEIYRSGGEPRLMTIERIKLFSVNQSLEMKKRILQTLEYNILQIPNK